MTVHPRRKRAPGKGAAGARSSSRGRPAGDAAERMHFAAGETDVVLRLRHVPGPWLYRKMVTLPKAAVPNGAFVPLRDREGRLVGRGFVNRRSEVAFRLVAAPAEPPQIGAVFDLRLAAAHRLRQDVLRLGAQTDAYRLVHGEGDGLSGLVVDCYGRVAVASLFSIGYVAHAETLERALRRVPGIEEVIFIADARSQELEGFTLPPPRPGLEATVREGRVRFRVDLSHGHKTGLFLDQRDNRALAASFAAGRRVLDLGTNAGAFALACAATGKARRIVGVDLDEAALERARANARLNRAAVEFVHADLFPWLRERTAAGERHDLVVLDPPKMARHKDEVPKALAAYRDMNAGAFAAVAPGGLFLTFSCTGLVSEELFLDAVREGARRAGRPARVLRYLGAAPDHPVSLEFPEGRYLKGALLFVP